MKKQDTFARGGNLAREDGTLPSWIFGLLKIRTLPGYTKFGKGRSKVITNIMSKNILIIAILIIATIGLAATAGYILQRQVAKEVRQERVATRPEIPGKPVVQPTTPSAPLEVPAPPTTLKPAPTTKTETSGIPSILEPKSEPESKPAIDTSDWGTYQDEEYGFEIRYPKGWFLWKPPFPEPEFSFSGKWGETLTRISICSNCTYPSSGPGVSFVISIYSNPKNLSILEFAREQWKGELPKGKIECLCPALGYETVFGKDNISGMRFFYPFATVMTAKDGYIFEFSMYSYDPAATVLDLLKFDQILSTFRFLK